MIIMHAYATQSEIESVVTRVEDSGLRAYLIHGEERTVIGLVGDERPHQPDRFSHLPGVKRVIPISRPYKLASKEFYPQHTVVPVRDVHIGGEEIVIIAGPCSVESRTQIIEAAHAAQEAGAHILRGGAFKPRTSPYSFQGLGEEGLELLAEARQVSGLGIVTEVMSPENVPLVGKYADMLQIGSRNMQNYALLHAVGESHRPVLLKRGMNATINEWLMAAEYILSHGNWRVVLCERGIRTFETATRNTTDINAIPVLKDLTHLPVILDPSHSTGNWKYVTSVGSAAVAAGADGLIVEIHPDPENALSDGGQSLKPERFANFVKQMGKIAEAVGRSLPAREAIVQCQTFNGELINAR
jgi:3-deoxy-7-phosphoheptulonate synthase